ncbi:hypothetical protein SUDANB121_05967 (plasmid) [Nocardiopsis dassonvillei]|uniref:hypothetical protein n=1 Tax=Nocardiopsis dassonvillei TaxID=2014 RepID=UPI003F54D286
MISPELIAAAIGGAVLTALLIAGGVKVRRAYRKVRSTVRRVMRTRLVLAEVRRKKVRR